jgi:hypothetical protein
MTLRDLMSAMAEELADLKERVRRLESRPAIEFRDADLLDEGGDA